MEQYTVNLRALNEVAYCERLFHIMYVQKIFENNADTIMGKMHHKTRENGHKNNMLEGMELNSLILYTPDGNLSGKLDNIQIDGGEYIPIEDKNSKAPENLVTGVLWGFEIKTQVWINDLPQLVGQMYMLRKNGYMCNRGKLYYRGSNQMIEIMYEEWHDNLIEAGIEKCKRLLQDKQPKPLEDSDKCIRCSLNWVCLPDEVNMLNEKVKEPRRLYPGRPDTSILYVTSSGGKIGKTGECLSIFTSDSGKFQVPIKDVEHVCIFGNVQITTQALHEIIKNESTISYYTSGGWYIATTAAATTKNINLRIEQFKKFGDGNFCCELAKKTTMAKILNQRTILRRNKKSDIDTVLRELNISKKKVAECTNIDSVRGYEGLSAKSYWEGYAKLFNEPEKWRMLGRNRRPPKDPINAMLSYGYALLLRDCISALNSIGMDYLYGFFHTVVPGRPSLALDIMEPYRPLVVDSIVLRMINEGIVKGEQFAYTDAGVYMTSDVKNRIIYMYEKRMDEMITHPQFGYRLSYRRMINLEAKLLSKYLTGEIDIYEPLTTR